ncbi:MAG: PIG-L family deacetylase [Clostridiales bacterium]|nr:PIG-L family deacetylase [Clostridiales bacterium]
MYPTIQINRNDKLLIVAPHPDDETIGCGGILSLYGPQCDVLLLTDGRRGVPEGSKLTMEETASIRKEEFIAVMDFFGVHSYQTLDIPDGELASFEKTVSGTDIRSYDKIFVPNRRERHPDHKAAFEIIRRMQRRQKAKAELIEYEVWSPIVSSNLFLDVSSIIETKTAGLRKYASQTASIDYEALVKGLNMYRAAPHHVSFCEAYYIGSDSCGAKEAISRFVPKYLLRKLKKTRR